MYRVLLWLFLGVVFYGNGVGQTPFPKKVHRIVFLGNSITYAGEYIVDIETYFITHYPEKHYEFINVGLPSETVSGLSEPGHAGGKFPRPDLHERLARVLALTKPDLVFAGYGMNDGIYMPFDEERFLRFREGILWLHREVVKMGALFIHLTPPVFDEQKGGHKGYEDVMDRYSTWLLRQRDSLGWRVADIHFPMQRYLEDRRRSDSSFAFARDGVHPDSLGHWIMAREILRFLGEKIGEGDHAGVGKKKGEVDDGGVGKKKGQGDDGGVEKKKGEGDDADVGKTMGEGDDASVVLNGKDRQIFRLVEEKQRLMKDAWLTAAGHKRPGMNTGLPLEAAKVKEAEIGKKIKELNK